jgi:hypothetical protein
MSPFIRAQARSARSLRRLMAIPSRNRHACSKGRRHCVVVADPWLSVQTDKPGTPQQ